MDSSSPASDRPESLTASGAPTTTAVTRVAPARVSLADYRRRTYESDAGRLRWRYESGLALD